VGIYFVGGKPYFGAIPAEYRDEFMKDSLGASDVMLRLAVSGPQYERGLKVLRTWDRRAREGALLYPDIFMDNILLVKQVTETLNQCGVMVKLHTLDWGVYDYISENNPLSWLIFERVAINEANFLPEFAYVRLFAVLCGCLRSIGRKEGRRIQHRRHVEIGGDERDEPGLLWLWA
jgi:hypothetical protein